MSAAIAYVKSLWAITNRRLFWGLVKIASGLVLIQITIITTTMFGQ